MPRYLEQVEDDPESDDDEEPRESDCPTVVACSGELVEQVSVVLEQLRDRVNND